MPKPPDYDLMEVEEWKKEQKNLKDEVKNPTKRLLQRIALFIHRFGYSEKSIINKISRDDMFAAHFAKEPRRTGFHERIAAEWINKLPNVHDFEVLPKDGNGAIKVTSDGNLEHGTATRTLPGKSLDFKWRSNNITYYAMHKYTKQGGGNQDSQYKEMIDLIKRFYDCSDINIILLIIVDGPYYQENDAKRLKQLRHHARTIMPISYALSIGELPSFLETHHL